MPVHVHTIQELMDSAQVAYEQQRDALQNASKAALTASNAKQTLLLRQQTIIRQYDDPKALGANEAARTAKIAEMSLTEQDALDAATVAEREARNVLEITSLEVSRVRLMVEIAKLAA